MLTFAIFCMLLGLVVFVIAAAGIPAGRVNLVAFGLAACTLAFIVKTWMV